MPLKRYDKRLWNVKLVLAPGRYRAELFDYRVERTAVSPFSVVTGGSGEPVVVLLR